MKNNLKQRGFIRNIITIVVTLFILAFILDYFDVDLRNLVDRIGLKEIIVSIWNFGVYLWVEYIWWFIVYIWDIIVDLINKLRG